MNNRLIAHLSDVHIMLNSRQQEYKDVFDTTIEQLKKIKPRRIVITGDLFHVKITLTPNALKLATHLLRGLSKIAPVDIILGNHDLDERVLSKGNTIEPLIDSNHAGYIIEDSTQPIPEHKGSHNGIYFYLGSGLYNVDDVITYGVFSIWDSKKAQIKISDKDPNRRYIALYHAPIFGSVGSTGFEMRKDHYMKLKDFNGFDMVMLGDIHKFQSFSRVHDIDVDGKSKKVDIDSVAYSGSLLQRDYGESVDKGFLIWDINELTFKRELVPNQMGFCRLKLALGEKIEDRLKDLYFSADKKKTKIHIIYKERPEDYSAEKERQMTALIKSKYKCEKIEVEAEYVKEDGTTDSPTIDTAQVYENFDEYLRQWLTDRDCEMIDDVVELSNNIDKTLNINDKRLPKQKWDIIDVEFCNLFSFGMDVVNIPWERLQGVIGVFGENFSGKSNIIRTLVWIFYGKILGGGENYEAVNIYNRFEKAYGSIRILMNGEQYKIYRSVQVKQSKSGKDSGKLKCTYDLSLTKLVDGKWEPVKAKGKANEVKDIKQLIEDNFGEYDDFTKVSLQTQDGSGDYLSLAQQPKNDLINKYLGLEPFRDRYEYANEDFKILKSTQKEVAELESMRDEAKSLRSQTETDKKELSRIEKEKEGNDKNIDKLNNTAIELSKKIIPITERVNDTAESITEQIGTINISMSENQTEEDALKLWLSNNFKIEVPPGASNGQYNKDGILSELEIIRGVFNDDKLRYQQNETWLNGNPKKTIFNTSEIENGIFVLESELKDLNHKLAVANGEQCNVCGSVLKKADPTMIERYNVEMHNKNIDIVAKKKTLQKAKDVDEFNRTREHATTEQITLKATLITKKASIGDLKKRYDDSDLVSTAVSKNMEIDEKHSKMEGFREFNIRLKDSADNLRKSLEILDKNTKAEKANKEFEDKLELIKEQVNERKMTNLSLSSTIGSLSMSVRIAESSLSQLNDKIESIAEAELNYKKYSIYLQAVHRNGIPAKIISDKLPIINAKINNILSKMVDYKIELYVTDKGDVRELFYKGDTKEYTLPLGMGSGSQKFISTVAIRDALHFVSDLTKPSFCAIDEGFGTLDDINILEIGAVLSYFKNKYTNVIVMSHMDVIKDFMDGEVRVRKISDDEESGAWHTELTI